MVLPGEVVLRQRICRGSGCHVVFWICQHCDRGQRYCSPVCRGEARRRQHRTANCATSGVRRAGLIIAIGNVLTANVTRQFA
jgi:hypothetical protein